VLQVFPISYLPNSQSLTHTSTTVCFQVLLSFHIVYPPTPVRSTSATPILGFFPSAFNTHSSFLSLHANRLAPAFPIPISLMNSDSCPICNQIETSPLTRIELSQAMCVLLHFLYLRKSTEEDWTLGMNNLVVAIILHSSSSPFIALPNYHFNKITPVSAGVLIANPVPLIPSKFQNV